MQVSNSTVVEAYERLAAEGRRSARGRAPASTSPARWRRCRWRRSARGSTAPSIRSGSRGNRWRPATTVLKPGCGWLPASWLPEDEHPPRAAQRSRAPNDRRPRRLRHAARPRRRLRQLLARRMAEQRHRGLARPDHADGIRHAGDRPALPLPARARRHGAGRRSLLLQFPRPAARPSGQDRRRALYARRGRTSSCSRRRSTEHRPRLYITNSGLHNPTGATLSPVTAHRVLKLAEQAGLTIVEDDIFADFEHTPGAAARGLRRPRPRHPDRQLLQDAVGLGPLRLHRRAAGLDRGADRPEDRHHLRRRAPGGRAGAQRAAATAAIASTWSGCARACRTPWAMTARG